MTNTALPAIVEPLLDYLSDVLPPSAFAIIETLLSHIWSLTTSLFALGVALVTSSPSSWEAEKILPPIITLLATYLALLSFYRTTGWMIRTAFAFVKWGFILTTLGAAAGYFLANGAGGNGLGAFGGGGLVPMIGGYLLDLLSGSNTQQGANTSRSRVQTRKGAKSQSKSRPRPKAWDSWDRQKNWQYKDNAQEGQDPAAEIQKVVGEVLGAAGRAVKESGWWESAKGVVNDFTQSQEGQRTTEGKQKAKPQRSR